MKARTIVLTLVLCLLTLAVGFAAENPAMGTWKLNEAKSKIPAGAPKNTTVVYSPAGDETKVTTEGVNASGQPAQSKWTGKFDGKEYPVTGDPNVSERSYKVINERTMELTNTKDGKPVSHGKLEVARDGKTRTLDVESTAGGKKMSAKYVYDKQ